MSWIIPWNQVDYDVDPLEFSGLELKEIKLKAGFTFKQLIAAVGDLDADAIRALFWTVARRADPALTFSDYAGPTMREFLPHLDGFEEALSAGAVGKALGITKKTSETPGSPSSPTEPDGPDDSKTS